MSTVSLIINVLIAYGMLQAFFISVVLLKSQTRTLFKKLFAVLLIIEGVTLFERLLVETELINSVPHLLGISYPISFLKPPLMWFMTLAITDRSFKLEKRCLWHLIPFALMLLMNLPLYTLSGAEKLEWARTFMEKIPSYSSFDFYFSLSFFAYIGVYIFSSIRKMNQVREHVSNNALLNWYRLALIGYGTFLFLHLVYFAIQPAAGYNFAIVNQVSMLAMTFMVQAVAFKLLDRSPLLNARAPDLGDLNRREKYQTQILEALERDKLYLDASLTLQKFSETLALPASYVTELINQKFNCSFKKLVNQYRLLEAKRIMENTEADEIKLIDVAYEAGFNNKVSFYRVFKELEGMSPSEYLGKIKQPSTG